jgi:hypothetical protein
MVFLPMCLVDLYRLHHCCLDGLYVNLYLVDYMAGRKS